MREETIQGRKLFISTVFPRIVFAFESGKCGNFHIVSPLWQFFYFINSIVAAETIQKRKLFAEIRYIANKSYQNMTITKVALHFYIIQ